MTFLETLQAHKGGLIKLETELYWYGARGRDGNPGRVCLLLDADAAGETVAATTVPTARRRVGARALLLIDGSPKWVWVDEEDAELL